MCPSHEKPRSTVEPGTAPGPRRLVFVLVVAALMAGTSDAQAQPSGLVAGFSIGGGVLGVDRVTGDDGTERRDNRVTVTGASIYVGHMLDESTAGMFVVAGAIGDFGKVVEAAEFDVFGVAVQRWLAPNVWVRGGAGYGVIDSTDPTTVEFNMNGSDIGWLAGAGIDVWSGRDLAVNVEFHFVGAWGNRFSIRAPTVHLGFNWH